MAFIGIRVPKEVGRLLNQLEVPGEKESPSEYHITLFCFEDNWPISDLVKTIKTVFPILSEEEPFSVSSNKVNHFPSHEDGPIPIIAPIDSESLHKLHKKLYKALDGDKIDFKKTFKDYKPHITLAYSEQDYDDFKIDFPVEFTVNEVVLWGGDLGDNRIIVTFPLKAPQRKNAFLLQQIELFNKIANNPLCEYLTPSSERRQEER